MSSLQEAVERSQAGASEQTTSYFAHGFLDVGQVVEVINDTQAATIATVSHAGLPHAAYVIAACLDETIHFTVTPGSVLERNLDHQSRIGFTIVNQHHSIMGQGDAVRVARSLDAPDLLEALGQVTSSGTFTPPGWDGLVYRIEPRRLVGG